MNFLREIDYRSPAILSLIIFNLVIISLAVIENWSLFMIIFCYWTENLIIGLFNFFKILKAQQKDEPSEENNIKVSNQPITGEAAKTFMAFFFLIHYYGFCAGHGFFIFHMFGSRNNFSDPSMNLTLLLGIVMLVVSHAVSYKVNFLNKEEYKTATPAKQMFSVYKRIVFIHIFILIGGGLFMIIFKSLPIVLVVLFMLGKVILDLRQHYMEHKNAQENSSNQSQPIF